MTDGGNFKLATGASATEIVRDANLDNFSHLNSHVSTTKPIIFVIIIAIAIFVEFLGT